MNGNKNGWKMSNIYPNQTNKKDLSLTEATKLMSGEPVYKTYENQNQKNS